jgi:hypothetical protein
VGERIVGQGVVGERVVGWVEWVACGGVRCEDARI